MWKGEWGDVGAVGRAGEELCVCGMQGSILLLHPFPRGTIGHTPRHYASNYAQPLTKTPPLINNHGNAIKYTNKPTITLTSSSTPSPCNTGMNPSPSMAATTPVVLRVTCPPSVCQAPKAESVVAGRLGLCVRGG